MVSDNGGNFVSAEKEIDGYCCDIVMLVLNLISQASYRHMKRRSFNILDNTKLESAGLSLNSPEPSLILRATSRFTWLGKPTDRN